MVLVKGPNIGCGESNATATGGSNHVEVSLQGGQFEAFLWGGVVGAGVLGLCLAGAGIAYTNLWSRVERSH